MSTSIAVIGDVHGCWDEVDNHAMAQAGYDWVFFVGDLPRHRTHRDLLEVAGRMSSLTVPAFLMPGNHDGTTMLEVGLEAVGLGGLSVGAAAMADRVDALTAAVYPVEVVGYSRHALAADLDLIAARPHAMDGRHLTFRRYLHHRFGVNSLADSVQRMRRLIDESSASRLVFLSHNGPAGAGREVGDPWAFSRMRRDNGDSDLAEALRYATNQGRQVMVALAGHMHHRANRAWKTDHNGLTLVNAARVPRIWRGSHGGRHRHHVRVDIDGEQVLVTEVT